MTAAPTPVEVGRWLFAASLALVACTAERPSTTPFARDAGVEAAPGSGGASGLPDTGSPDGPAGEGGPGSGLRFRKIVLSTEFLSEGASYGDFDRDGATDVVAGPYWYPGPDFASRHVIYPAVAFDPLRYSDNFFAWVRDLSGDGWDDVLFVGFPGQAASWFENPAGTGGTWTRHEVVSAVGNESPDFVDITGDGEPELVFIAMDPGNVSGRYGWAGPSGDPRSPWSFHPVSPPGAYTHFTHGMGVGDLDGDGRADLLEATGHWSQPASLVGDPVWVKHEAALGQPGGAQMAALDVDGDGDADVVTTLAAHGYGLSWFEQASGSFTPHPIVPLSPTDAGVVLHEPHALTVADLDGDGLSDIVTGERFWGHVPDVRDLADPARLYWFEAVRGGGGATFLPHLIDDASGVGTQVVTGDVTGDGLIDIVVANKKGAFVFVQERG